ncbi:MAG: phosphoribosylglycinamide formyltransferase [Actinobacteria bacterium]|nr:phosphoribosylglycinamide formyltransferase [Actinomycetota bacterium]
MSALRLGVLVSGSGSNLQAILDKCASGELPAAVTVVVSDKADAFALERAARARVSAVHINRKDFESAASFNEEIARILIEHGVELVIMAGYMRLLGKEVLDAFPNRVFNLHPALLPSFPGAHGIVDALDFGVKVTGVTVHFASDVFDDGPIILQEAVPVNDDDNEESLAARIHAAEHCVLPQAIKLFAEGRLAIEGRRVRVLPEKDKSVIP